MLERFLTSTIFNIDQEWTVQMKKKFFKAGDITFSERDPKADVVLRIEEMTQDALKIRGHIHGVSGEAVVPVFGKQNLTNLLAAAGIASLSGVAPDRIWLHFAECRTTWGRNQFLPLRNGSKLLFDAYNANPDSMTALLDNLELMKNQSLMGVFGQMRELGKFSSEAHRQLGEKVGNGRFEKVFFVGEDRDFFLEGVEKSGAKFGVIAEQDWSPSLQSKFEEVLQPRHLVAMKASRGTRLERFLPATLLDPIYLKKPKISDT
jgi:UDP-N-acetylmuramoyl-tripeptide--D-alanyl-D-alanine ligase